MVQPETRLGQEHLKILRPEMMMMKRTKPRKKLKDNTICQSGKSQEPQKHDLVVKVTGGSPNYMKGTTSSEARKEKKMKRLNLSRNQKNQTGLKHDSRMVRGFTKAPSFKRCSQRATCSSTLKDSKFPEYLMLKHGETHDEVNGSSVLKVCPYKYCSLNGHLQYPPLKSFISSRRQSLKSQKCVKMEALEEEFVEIMDIEEKKEYGNGNGETFETQISETLVDNIQETTCEVDVVTQILETDDASDNVEMVMSSEGELKESGLEETQEKAKSDEEAESGRFRTEVMGMIMKSEEDENDAGDETVKHKDRIEVIWMMEETAKVPQKPCNQEEPEEAATISWSIKKCKKPVAENEDLREFNPREPHYLPIVVEADNEKVDLKHQDMDERKNSEDWMFDYALQRTVTKLSSARKRKVALLVEAFETVQPVMPRDTEPAPVLSYGRHLQACN